MMMSWRRARLASALMLCLALSTASVATQTPYEWRAELQKRLEAIEADFPGELGVYVKDLGSDETFSFRGDEVWYLASLIKVPVAIAVLRRIERDELKLASTVRLDTSDYVDGAGETNWQAPGSELRIDFLLEQMLTASDNTAADMLIRRVGLDAVNHLTQALVVEGLGPITTLVDVRRQAYGNLHPRAFELDGMDFITLQKAANDRQRVEIFRQLLGLAQHELRATELDSAFATYYSSHLNSGSLSAYGRLLEALAEGRALPADDTAYLMAMLHRVTTGTDRIKAGLPPGVNFAHKTGTQHRRMCDAGIVSHKASTQRVVVVACTRGYQEEEQSKVALAAVGAAVAASGVLEWYIH